MESTPVLEILWGRSPECSQPGYSDETGELLADMTLIMTDCAAEALPTGAVTESFPRETELSQSSG